MDATIQSFRKSYFHISYRRYMPGTLACMAAASLGDSCESGKMARLFNSIFFVFKFGFCLTIMSNMMIIL